MKYLKKLYGKTVIDSSDSEEMEGDRKIELEYYETKKNILFFKSNKPYGIEVVKRCKKKEKTNIETAIINNICKQEQDTYRLLEILKTNKVTPISVKEIISDLRVSLG